VKKDIVIAAVAIVVVVALAFGLAALRPDRAATPAQSAASGENATAGKTSTDKVIMHVNGEPITEREFTLFIESAPPESRAFYGSPAGRRALADELVKLKVLEQEGERLGVTSDPDVRVQMEMAQAQIAAGRTLEKLVDQKSEQQIRAEYEKEKASSVSLRHILIAYAGGAVPAPAGKQAPPADVAMRKAQEIAAKLRAGADFAQMAKAESDDVQSGSQGGMLGPARPDMLPPDIAGVVSKLKPGQMSDPVKTQFGIHIFKVEQPSLEDLRPMLRQKVRQQAAAEEVKRLQDAAKVELDPKFFPPAAKVPSPAPPGAPKTNG
jgi:peptidyl-prolyl cis-trans isomerase C